jgi:Raf kinase inhibitor-like YbhB/YbcL family protein
MKFYSKDFENMATIPVRFTADGENTCPKFVIKDVPNKTVSLAIICHDPDATRGYPWIHWLVWDLPIETNEISDDTLPENSKNGLTSFGTKGYGGPSPSPGSGPHRYVFTCFALRESIDLTGMGSYIEIISFIEEHIIDQANWTGNYERTL